MREKLNLPDDKLKTMLSPKTKQNLKEICQRVEAIGIKIENVEMQDLDQTANKVIGSVKSVLAIPELSEDNWLIEGSEFTLCELWGLDITMQTIHGKLANMHIAIEKWKFEQVKAHSHRNISVFLV